MVMKATEKSVYLLTGDVGGTNSRISFYKADPKTGTSSCTEEDLIHVKYFSNSEHLKPEVLDDPKCFQNLILSPFLHEVFNTKIDCGDADSVSPETTEIYACLAIAGFVNNNQVRLTNLGNMLVDGALIQNADVAEDKYLAMIVECQIINDFVAQGYGCLTLKPTEVKHLRGPKLPDGVTSFETGLQGPKVCVGAGTGLGECYLTPFVTDDNETKYVCFPSEGGHVEYAPRNELEVELWMHLLEKFKLNDRISVERVVSGIGLANVYEFLAEKKMPFKRNKKIHEEFVAAGDKKGQIVGQNATNDEVCTLAMSIMMSAYGCEVGSAALKWIPTGGLFVTGGLTPKNIHFIECGPSGDSPFVAAYKEKGRVSSLLDKIPLYAVMVEDLGVRGAHYKAAQMIHDSRVHLHHDLVEAAETQLEKEHRHRKSLWMAIALGHVAMTLAVGFPIFKRMHGKK